MIEAKKAEGAGRKLRRAGLLEEFFNSVTRLKLNSYVVVLARYVNATGAPLSRSVLFPALEQMIRQHPALSARLPPPGPELSWVQLPAVDLNKIVTFFDDKDFNDLGPLIEELFARPIEFVDDLPVWRLLVLRDGTVVFAYDHIIGDGQSGFAFHHTLLTALKNTPEPVSEHSGLVASPQDATLPPPIEDAMDVSPPPRIILREISKLVFPFLDRKPKGSWTGYPVLKEPTFETTVRLLNYSPQDCAALVTLARGHKTRLTGIIHTLSLVVLSRLLYAQPGGAKKFKTAPTNIPVSLRKYANTPPTVICNHVSSCSDTHPLIRNPPATVSADNFPWNVAASLSGKLKREARRTAKDLGLLKYLGGKYDQYLLARLGQRRRSALELSNLGAFPPVPASTAADETWRVEESLFVQADATMGAAFTMSACGTGAGGLGVSITWGKGKVDNDFAEEFVKAFGEGMDVLAGRLHVKA